MSFKRDQIRHLTRKTRFLKLKIGKGTFPKNNTLQGSDPILLTDRPTVNEGLLVHFRIKNI